MDFVYILRVDKEIVVFRNSRSVVAFLKREYGSFSLARPTKIDRLYRANTERLVEYLEAGYAITSAPIFGEHGHTYEIEATKESIKD